jgi:hypothetical protein
MGNARKRTEHRREREREPRIASHLFPDREQQRVGTRRAGGRLARPAVTHAQQDDAGGAAEHQRCEQRRERRLDDLGQCAR